MFVRLQTTFFFVWHFPRGFVWLWQQKLIPKIEFHVPTHVTYSPILNWAPWIFFRPEMWIFSPYNGNVPFVLSVSVKGRKKNKQIQFSSLALEMLTCLFLLLGNPLLFLLYKCKGMKSLQRIDLEELQVPHCPSFKELLLPRGPHGALPSGTLQRAISVDSRLRTDATLLLGHHRRIEPPPFPVFTPSLLLPSEHICQHPRPSWCLFLLFPRLWS